MEFLIHGYGVGASYNILGYKTKPAKFNHSGFIAYPDAYVFNWFTEKNFGFLETVNLLSHYRLYKYEQKIANSKSLQARLNKELELKNPETIICHSMGCFLLLEYFRSYKPCSNLKRVILLQGDYSSSYNLPKSLTESKQIEIFNFYNWLDQALFQSSVLSLNLKAGQIGWKSLEKEKNNVIILQQVTRKNILNKISLWPKNYHTQILKQKIDLGVTIV
jgi:hypothetical protein